MPSDADLDKCLQALNDCKAVGEDEIQAELYKASSVARRELFDLIKQCWLEEDVPEDMVRGLFVTLFKNKGSSEDMSKYRCICLLNHAYKMLSSYLLLRLLREITGFLEETQAGFRQERGTRDNVVSLSALIDEVITRGESCVITFIDFVSAFDTVSHRFLDEAIKLALVKGSLRVSARHSDNDSGESADDSEREPVSWKCRAMFRAIYSKASARVRIKESSGECMYSRPFPVRRGVVQGDVFSPVCFIIALTVILQRSGYYGDSDMPEAVVGAAVDDMGVSERVEQLIRDLADKFEYADDAAMVDADADAASVRVSRLCECALDMADMEVSVPKTKCLHVKEQKVVSPVRQEEYAELMKDGKFKKYKCDYCRKFASDKLQGLKIHWSSCGARRRGVHEEEYLVEALLDVRGDSVDRFYKVLWAGYDESEATWEPVRHLDKQQKMIAAFWSSHPDLEESEPVPDHPGEFRCEWCCEFCTDETRLKIHRHSCCEKPRPKIGTRAERAALRKKLQRAQELEEKVQMCGKPLENVYQGWWTWPTRGHWGWWRC